MEEMRGAEKKPEKGIHFEFWNSWEGIEKAPFILDFEIWKKSELKFKREGSQKVPASILDYKFERKGSEKEIS